MNSMPDLTAAMHKFANQLAETGAEAASKIADAQTLAVTSEAGLEAGLERIATSEVEEIDRHAVAMAALRTERDQALDKYLTAADESRRRADVALLPLKPSDRAGSQLKIAG